MKQFFATLTILSLFFSPLAVGQEQDDEQVFYTDEDDDLFNKGKFVGQETDQYLVQIRRRKAQNWGIALGTTALGVAALLLSAKHK